MQYGTSRSIKEGLGFGVIAGLVFAAVQIIAAAALGNPPLTPLRMFASIVLGTAALQTVSIGVAVLIGLVVHVVLSAGFGLIYGLAGSLLRTGPRSAWAIQTVMGLAAGLVIWAFNFQVIARVLYPWFLTTPQFMQAAMHAVFFGLPLSLMYAASERRIRPREPQPTG